MTPEGRAGYRRSLGLVELVCLGIGGTIGSGIFVVPGEAARLAGETSLLAWLLVAASACSVAYALAALQAHVMQRADPSAASLPGLLVGAFGKRPAAVLVGLYVLASLFGIATIAAGLGQYLGWLGGPSLVAHDVPVEIAIVVAFLLLNLRGMAASGSAENLLSVLKVGGILAIILVLLPDVEPRRLVPAEAVPASALLQVVIIVYWSFTGFEISALPVDEVKDAHAMQRALWWVMLLVCVVYLALNVVLLGTFGAPALGASDAPLADAVRHLFPGAGQWVAVLAIVTMLSALNAYIVGASRALHGVAQLAGIGPMARLSAAGVPAPALWACCLGAALMLCFSNRFSQLAALAVTLTLVPYIALCWSAFRALERPRARGISLFGALVTTAILVAYFLT